MNDLKNTIKSFLFQMKDKIEWDLFLMNKLNISWLFMSKRKIILLLVSKWETKLLLASELRTELLFMNELKTELLLSSEWKIKLLLVSELKTELLLLNEWETELLLQSMSTLNKVQSIDSRNFDMWTRNNDVSNRNMLKHFIYSSSSKLTTSFLCSLYYKYSSKLSSFFCILSFLVKATSIDQTFYSATHYLAAVWLDSRHDLNN